jgi:benzoylformate decarboxylase
MSEFTGGDLFVDALEQYDVEYLFGNPGTTELPVMAAVADSDVEYVLGLHEDVAVGMAGGYAQTMRYHADPNDEGAPPVGVVNLHTTGGVAHGLGNLYNAHVNGAALVVTAGHHSTDFRHEEPILSGDLEAMTDQFCKWSAEVLDASAMPTMLRRAFRVAMTPPTGPVFLSLPLDVTMAETDERPERLGQIPSGGPGDPTQVERAVDRLVEADAPVLVVGDGIARSGTDAVAAAVDLAEATGARVHGEALACEVNLPTDHDQWVSFVPPYEDLFRTVMNADTVMLVGCSTHTTLTRHDADLLDEETTTLIQIADDAWQVGKNQPADAAVLGDPGLVMNEIADAVAGRISEEDLADRLEQVEMFKSMASQQMDEMGGEAQSASDPSNGDEPREEAAGDSPASKADLVDAMRAVAPDAYVVDESVTSRFAMLTRWPFEPQQFLGDKGNALGYGLAASVGAALAEGDQDDPRTVYGFVGDGSYLYYPHAMYSAARLGVDLTVVVSDNRNYRILKDNTMDVLGGEEDDHEFVGMDFEPPVDLPANAESHGAAGHLVEAAGEVEDALGAAVDQGGPVLVDVLVQD